MSTLIKNGRIVTATDDYVADIFIDGEVVSAIGRNLPMKADHAIDARGKLVIPGAIDPHVHMELPFGGTVSSDDFKSGTIAAAFGGTTTIIDFAIQSRGMTMTAAIDAWDAKTQNTCAIDYGYHLAITSFENKDQDEMKRIYDRGITSGRNLVDIQALKWNTIGGVPLTESVQDFWRPWLRRQAPGLPLTDRVQLNKTTFYVTTRPYAINQVQGTLYLCLNPRQQEDLRDSRREEIVHAQPLLRAGKAIKAGLQKYFDQRGEVQPQVLADAEEFDGYSSIFATRPLPKDQLIHLYFDGCLA